MRRLFFTRKTLTGWRETPGFTVCLKLVPNQHRQHAD